jgi:FkbH-like protein
VPESSPFRFEIAATFTADPLRETIGFWEEPLQSRFAVNFAPFGQVVQTVLDAGSGFGANDHGVNVLLLRLADLGEPARRRENLETVRQAVAARAGHFRAPLLVAADEELDEAWTSLPGVFAVQPAWIDRLYPVARKDNPRGEQLGGIPFSSEYYVALGTALVRAAHAAHRAPYKVLALDCDQTLWEGICGEDGPGGVRLTAGHRALQEFALRQREAGLLLTLVSKNNDPDVVETFAAHPEFPLELRHITARRIDWRPKPEGLRELARELSLGLDAFVFVDDNAREVSEVEEQLPMVLGLQLPPDAGSYSGFLEHVWAFDQLQRTAADASRAASYESVQEFGKALNAAGSLQHFYDTLELEVEVRPVTAGELPRAAQLTQRTNQFNFTTVRRSEPDLQALLAEGYRLYGVHVRDRFGDYGFTGLVGGRATGDQFSVDTFLLSCRVLGRGVEHAVLRALAELPEESVELAFVPTAKNAPAAEFRATLPAKLERSFLSTLQFVPSESQSALATVPVQAAARHGVDYSRIARELNTVAKIQECMYGGNATQLETPTETRLGRIWQELLGPQALSGESSFFQLGGHSLKVVLLLIRIEEEFGAALGIEDVYAAEMTLERLARRIDEMVTFGGVGREAYTEILRQIEAMSEEEALAALEEEIAVDANSARG